MLAPGATAQDAGGLVAQAEREIGNVFQFIEPVAETGIEGVFAFLDAQQWVFILVALAIGYPLGRLRVGPISLGSTASTLLVAVLISMAAQVFFGLTYAIPGIVSTIFLSLFMYALGLGVGPKFFAGLKAAGVLAILLIVAYYIRDRIFRMNSVINAGCCAGGRNATPALDAVLEQSKSQVAAAPFPVAYALTTVLALVGGYLAQIVS